jgi:Protein of unknown function (DUF1574)
MVRPKRHRGRKVLIIAAALILTGEIGAGFLIDHAPRKIRFPHFARVMNSIRPPQSSKTILFFGSSRFGNAISVQTVTAGLRESNADDGFVLFNAAVGAGDPVAMEFLTDKLLAAGIHPSMVIVEILPEVMARRNLWLNFHLGRQFTWLETWKSLPDAHLAGTLSVALATRLNAVYTFRNEFQQWAIDALGLPFEPAAVRETIAKRRQAMNRFKAGGLQKGTELARKNVRRYEIGGLNARALSRMLAQYSAVGTTVVLVAPPVSSPYLSGYPAPVNQAYLDYMRRLGKMYGTYFFDFRDRLPDRYFYTPYYTNPDGKLLFSQLVAREILVPLLSSGTDSRLKTTSIKATEKSHP